MIFLILLIVFALVAFVLYERRRRRRAAATAIAFRAPASVPSPVIVAPAVPSEPGTPKAQ